MDFWILFLISVPVFYILGIVQFVTWISRRPNPPNPSEERKKYLTKAIPELEQALKENHDKLLKDQLEEYRKEFAGSSDLSISYFTGVEQKEHTQESALPVPKPPEEQPLLKSDVSTIWSSWYSNNSINLLLYIGAFLIVAAAAIFVGFQWETIPGVSKAIMLVLLTVLFFGFGFWFYRYPKIQFAGSTFIGIGALLVPICGAAWYNFVLVESGVPFGTVWLVTSLIMLAVYALLAIRLKQVFYTYILSLSTLSFSFSIVNTAGLENKYYILASVISSFVLMLSSLITKDTNKELKRIVSNPLQLSSHVLMPASLIYGLYVAISADQLYSVEAAISVLMGAAFYFLVYYVFRKSWAVLVGEGLLAFAIFLYCESISADMTLMLGALAVLGMIYIGIAHAFEKEKTIEESNISIGVGLTLVIICFIFAYVQDLSSHVVLAFSLVPAMAGVLIAYLKKNIYFVGISTLFIGVGTFIGYFKLLELTANPEYLSLLFVLLALGSYALVYYYKSKHPYIVTFGATSAVYFFVSMLLSYAQKDYLFGIALLIAMVIIHATHIFKQKELLYLSNVFLYFALWSGLGQTGLSTHYYVFAFMMLSYALYFCHMFLPEEFRLPYRNSGLVGSILTPFFGMVENVFENPYGSYDAQRNSLITAYGTTMLFALDTVINRVKNFGYVTSAIGMFTYFWQIHFLGVTEVLMYTIPLGVYFLVLGYLRRHDKNEENKNILYGCGVFAAIAAPTFLSFGVDSLKYSLVLGLEGIIFILLGISVREKLFRYAGIFALVFAVISQTYSYIFSLPRWLIVGFVGMAFIGVALFLLLRRKESK